MTATEETRIVSMLQQAVSHHQAGRLSKAEDLYRQVLRERPHLSDALHLLGVILYQQGNLFDAIDLIHRAIGENEDIAIYHLSLGNVLQTQESLDEAIASYRKAISITPDYADAYSNLGAALKAKNCLKEADICYRKAILLQPNIAEAHSNLGNVLRLQGRLDEAVTSHRQAISLKPDFAEAWVNLGNVFQIQGLAAEAIACYQRALAIKPDDAETYCNLGGAFNTQGFFDEAIACCQKALALKPNHVDAYHNLGNILFAQCHLDQAIANYRQALQIKPNHADSHTAFVFIMDLKAEWDVAAAQAERRRWSETNADPLLKNVVFANSVEPDRRLRIGYVSADLRQHSAAIVFGAMLTQFDRGQFDVHVYSNNTVEDGYTERFKQNVTAWKSIVGLSDTAAADQVRQDRIDILIDLSGYTSGNRLLLFARKPAPIQITAWGYIGGTGMKAMDVFLADTVTVPPDEKKLYAEEVHYLPCAVSAWFPEEFPSITPLPVQTAEREGGGITFGSLNRLCKVSQETYRLWAQVMKALPASRMLMKTGELDNPVMQEQVLNHFREAGIDPNRISLLGKSSWYDHMDTFNRIDIALDPYPHGGGVTTMEGLMMGVPVVTLRWPTIPGRISASILTAAGLADWIAETQEEYVSLATQKAENLTELAELRKQLRSRFQSSILGDTAAYVQTVEHEYRKLWQKWCNSMKNGNQKALNGKQ